MLILLVDDNPDDRALARHAIVDAFPGAEVREATDAADFAAAFGDGEGIDLVVTDYELNWSDGLDILRRVKAARPGLPVVMHTGSGSEELAAAAMKAGLDDYVVKSPRGLPRLRASLRGAVQAARDRAALARSEADLRAALRQRDVLLAELHHRVKNNLQSAISLLRLRARRLPEDAQSARAELLEVAGRLQALAEVQARIHAADDFSSVDMRVVLDDLGNSLAGLYADKGIAVSIELDGGFALPVRQAAPLSLVCYELLLNVFKHAFAGREAGGALRLIHARLPDGRHEVAIADDGVGMDPAVAEGTGWTLIRSLAREAGAEIALASAPGGGGTRVTLRIDGGDDAPGSGPSGLRGRGF
jgi:two-component sensor histidine kinase